MEETTVRQVMVQKSVSEFVVNERIQAFLLVRASAQREDKNGRHYIDMNLADKTGEINCKIWDESAEPPKPGTIIKVQGLVQEYNGRKQLRIERIRATNDNDLIDYAMLFPRAPQTSKEMRNIIESTIDSFQSEDLKKIIRGMLRVAGDKLDYFPAAQRMHHAEQGGLLHHTTSMLNTANHIIESYPFLNADLLRAGVIIHDLAKIDEMDSDELGNVSDYTRDGLLIGHLVRGVATLEKVAENEGVGGEIVELLEHMIISHHGIPEYGSPRLPMFPEAEALHWIDSLDAKMNEMLAIQERTPEGAFSERIPYLDNRRMYHPFYTDDAE